jgi:hypothetical protein
LTITCHRRAIEKNICYPYAINHVGKGAKTRHALALIIATPSALCSALGKPSRLVVGKRSRLHT